MHKRVVYPCFVGVAVGRQRVIVELIHAQEGNVSMLVGVAVGRQ
jgi:hypothetical protein